MKLTHSPAAVEAELTTRLRAAVDKLAAEGNADQIALFLQQQGVQADPGCLDRCALAMWFSRETRARAEVSGDDAAAIHPHWYWLSSEPIALPEQLVDFVDRFDAGDYPALIAPETDD